MADQATPPPVSLSIPEPAPRIAPIAIVSLVLAILSFFCGAFLTAIPAIVCGHVAWSAIKKSGGALHGKGIAMAGLILGYVAIPIAVLQVWFLVGMIQGERERVHDLAVKRQQIASEDGKLSVTASGFWVKMPNLNKRATLQVGYKDNEMYLIVISNPKSTVPNMTLEKHHQTTRDRMLQEMQNSSATETASLTIDGHPALQDEVSGTQNGINLVFLHTTVDEGDNFHQILAWTLKSRWQKQNEQLREATNSFHSEK
jgi:Domain of unknown function (DUF4190)